MKKKVISVALAIMMSLTTVPSLAYAGTVDSNTKEVEQSEKKISVEQMTVIEKYEYANKVINAIIDSQVYEIGDYFTSECYANIIRDNTYYLGSASTLVCDGIQVSNSSNKDFVLMCNTKLMDRGTNYAYLFELHINADGKIYGYNIWAY